MSGDARVQALLEVIARKIQSILGDNLVGVYIHGSLAFGCFTWDQSDVDFLVVAQEDLPLDHKTRLISALLELAPACPPKGLEMSVVLRRHVNPFVHPAPFVLHFSNAHLAACRADLMGYCRRMNGVDPDLAAHVTVLRHAGYALVGEPVDAVFGQAPWPDYLDSILADVEDAEEAILRHPVYTVLNLCRVLAALRDGLVLSKEEGGRWGLSALPSRYAAVLSAALADYAGRESFHVPEGQLVDFSAYMQNQIRDKGRDG